LWLGSESNATSEADLRQTGAKFVLNVAAESAPLPKPELDRLGIRLLHIRLEDTKTQNLLPHFARAFEFIDEAERAQQPILVHCMQGVSRSATFVIAWLMGVAFQFDGCVSATCSFANARAYVAIRRSIIDPNAGFRLQLAAYQNFLQEFASPEATDASFAYHPAPASAPRAYPVDFKKEKLLAARLAAWDVSAFGADAPKPSSPKRGSRGKKTTQ
jgi:Dual specificity phosphatase, catalytic domain